MLRFAPRPKGFGESAQIVGLSFPKETSSNIVIMKNFPLMRHKGRSMSFKVAVGATPPLDLPSCQM